MANKYGLIDQSYNTGTTAQNFRQASANTAIGQTFTAGVSKKLTWASIYFNTRVGTPSGNVYLELYNSDFSSLLATSYVIASTAITAAALNTFIFSTPYTLTSTTVYGLVVRGSWAIDGSNYFTLYRNTISGYAGGSMFLFNGSSWADQSLDMRFNVFTNADGGVFDLDTSVLSSVLRTTIKGAALHATDSICAYNGAEVTFDENYTFLQAYAGKSVGSTGTTIADAASSQRWGLFTVLPGINGIPAGNATNTNSGFTSLLTAADATTSKNSRLQIGTEFGARCSITNLGNAVDTNQKYTINWPNGQVKMYNVDIHNSFSTPISLVATDSTKTANAPIIKNCSFDGVTNAAITFITPAFPVNIDLACDFRNNFCDASNVVGNGAVNIFVTTSAGRLISGGSIDINGSKLLSGASGNASILVGCYIGTNSAAPNTYYYNQKVAFADIRPTQIKPTGLVATDTGYGKSVSFTITNMASYANADFFEVATSAGVMVARFSKQRYVDQGNIWYSIPVLTNGTSYTFKARASSDNSEFSNWSDLSNAVTPSSTGLALPSTPATLTAQPLSSTAIRLEWSMSPITGGPAATYELSNDGINASVTGIVDLTYDDTGLTANTLYNYYVRARNTTGASAWSGLVSATTFNTVIIPTTTPIGELLDSIRAAVLEIPTMISDNVVIGRITDIDTRTSTDFPCVEIYPSGRGGSGDNYDSQRMVQASYSFEIWVHTYIANEGRNTGSDMKELSTYASAILRQIYGLMDKSQAGISPCTGFLYVESSFNSLPQYELFSENINSEGIGFSIKAESEDIAL